jgi:hypothetical protein
VHIHILKLNKENTKSPSQLVILQKRHHIKKKQALARIARMSSQPPKAHILILDLNVENSERPYRKN